jgi:hypothetical protein
VKKMAQNVAQPIFCQNKYTPFNIERSRPKIWATYGIY